LFIVKSLDIEKSDKNKTNISPITQRNNQQREGGGRNGMEWNGMEWTESGMAFMQLRFVLF
jgi:hypothetical protein